MSDLTHPDLECEDLQDARQLLSDGYQLIIERGTARWQHVRRRAFREEVDVMRAQSIYDRLKRRYHTRAGRTRLVLTPEVREGASDAGLRAVTLTRKWLTSTDLTDLVDLPRWEALEIIKMDSVTSGRITSRAGLQHVARADEALASVIEEHHPGMVVEVDIQHEERTLAPGQVTLNEYWYTYEELGALVDRSSDAVRQILSRDLERLMFNTTVENGTTKKVVYVTPALATVMEEAWRLTVTIGHSGHPQKRKQKQSEHAA
jgi:hypothetical protein